MSGHFTLRCKGEVTRCYVPKNRIRRKVEKPEYRERYERRVNGRANFNTHNLLCWVEYPKGN